MAVVKGGDSQPSSDRMLSAKEAADYIGVSLKRLYAFCNDGTLRHLRLAETKAGVLRFRRQWLDTWAEAKASGGIDRPSLMARPIVDPKLRFWVLGSHGDVFRLVAAADNVEAAVRAA